MSIPEPRQIIDDVDNYTQYEHLSNLQPIGYVKEGQVEDMAGQQRDVIVADGGELKDFKLDMEVEETQRIDESLVEFTILSSMPDVAFIMAEKFNTILNSCSGVFELQLSCDGNGPIQATVKEVVFPVEYTDFADVFFPMLVRELPLHALHDYTIETGNSQPPFALFTHCQLLSLMFWRSILRITLRKALLYPSCPRRGPQYSSQRRKIKACEYA